jgi:hypothetical protein
LLASRRALARYTRADAVELLLPGFSAAVRPPSRIVPLTGSGWPPATDPDEIRLLTMCHGISSAEAPLSTLVLATDPTVKKSR